MFKNKNEGQLCTETSLIKIEGQKVLCGSNTNLTWPAFQLDEQIEVSHPWIEVYVRLMKIKILLL